MWHVDDLKLSHKEAKVNDQFVEWLKMKCKDKEIRLIKAKCGKVHDYLGIILDCTEDGTAKINVINCIKAMAKDFAVAHHFQSS